VTGFEIRRLGAEELLALQRAIPAWNAREYAKRLAAQERGELVQVVAWEGDRPVGKGMVLFPAHEEYSTSAGREGCAEIRDVSVEEDARRRGVATALIVAIEEAARERSLVRIGLAVAQGDGDAPARALYDRLGYSFAHGPFVTSTNLWADDGAPIPVGAVMTYLVRDLDERP
jgi:GNAT superfamily N-acetyltransferase